MTRTIEIGESAGPTVTVNAGGASLIANRAAAQAGPSLRLDPPHGGVRGSHAAAVRAKILANVAGRSPVLDLGGGDAEFSRELATRADVVEFVADAGDPHRKLDPDARRFDAAIAIDRLGRVGNPEAMLERVRSSLQPFGVLVATVPNASHETVAAAIRQGRSPYGGGSPLDEGQLRLFTKDSLMAMIEAAGFAIGRIEPIDEPPDAGHSRDDAGVTGWVVAAHALPADDLRRVQSLLRESAEGRERADLRREAAESRHQEALVMLDAAHRRARALKEELDAAKSCLLEAHEQLWRRDEEHRAACREWIEARDASERQRTQGEAHLSALREALEAWHARSEAEFESSKQVLVSDREAALRRALDAEARCRDLEHRAGGWPRRVLRKIKRWLASPGS